MALPAIFDLASAQRIADAVRKVEIGDRDENALRFRRSPEDPRRIFRMGTIEGSWPVDTEKTVTFRNKTNPPNTASALNLFTDLPDNGGTQTVAIAREGTAWYLVEFVQDSDVFRIAEFVGSWPQFTPKVVEFISSPRTVVAWNLFLDFPDRDGFPYYCAVAKDGPFWFLIQWEWHTQTASLVLVGEDTILRDLSAEIGEDCTIILDKVFDKISVVESTYTIEIVQFGRPAS